MTAVVRTALVLASSQGLGLACASALAADGLAVCINGRRPEVLQQAARQILVDTHGASVQSVAADLGTESGLDAITRACPQADVLVLNVGGPTARMDAGYTRQEWMSEFESIFLSMAHLLDHYLPGMQARGWGRVVAISSIAIKQPIPSLVASGAMRSALAGLLHSRAQSAARHGVTINSILPGRILTPRQQRALERDAGRSGVSVEEHLREVSQSIPAGRLGRAEEVGAACAFLCSPKAGYITGQNLLVDGGAYRGIY